jgi:phosphoribosylformylglycinamidine cyclo-ligase
VPEEVVAIVAGVTEGCRRAGCALLGGETAEHPGAMAQGQFDLAGFCVGIVERDLLLGPQRVRPGDALVGFPSSGLHSNGFSLVRRVLLSGERSMDGPVPQLQGGTLTEELLQPTRIYSRPLLALARSGLARSAAHITGGGLAGNIPRALSPGMGAVIDKSSWRPLPIFGLVAGAAGIEGDDLFGVLNMGIGMVVVVAAGVEEEALEEARRAGADAVVIGRVVDGPGLRLV